MYTWSDHLILKLERLLNNINWNESVSDSDVMEVLEECIEYLYILKDSES